MSGFIEVTTRRGEEFLLNSDCIVSVVKCSQEKITHRLDCFEGSLPTPSCIEYYDRTDKGLIEQYIQESYEQVKHMLM